jgi:hypothetical protein
VYTNAGADKDATNKAGSTALMLADDDDIVRLLEGREKAEESDESESEEDEADASQEDD